VNEPDIVRDAFALLCLQVEWGADEALESDPIPRMRPARQGPSGQTGVTVRPTPAPRAAQSGTPVERAVAAAGGAADVAELAAAIAGFDGCSLRDTASHTVLAEGPIDAPVVLIGDTPGREEDRSGRPFAGAEGELLEQMLASIGLTRETLLLTHLLPWRPPGARPASAAELAICLPFLHRLLILARPARAVVLGSLASRTLLGPGANRRRGTREWMQMSIPGTQQPLSTLVLPSPAEIVKKPLLKRDAWEGWRRLRHALDAELAEK
jgi:uracil-DNA glycosylase